MTSRYLKIAPVRTVQGGMWQKLSVKPISLHMRTNVQRYLGGMVITGLGCLYSCCGLVFVKSGLYWLDVGSVCECKGGIIILASPCIAKPPHLSLYLLFYL